MSEEGLINLVRSVAEGLDYLEVTPAQVKGKSGLRHKFSALFRSEKGYFAVDIFSRAVEADVLKGRIKEQDARIGYCIESAATPPAKALELAKYYGIVLVEGEDREGLREVIAANNETGIA